MSVKPLLYRFRTLALASGASVFLIMSGIILSYQLVEIRQSVEDEGEFLTEIVFTHLLSYMQDGWNKQDIEQHLEALNGFHEDIRFHLHRSPQVEALYGIREDGRRITPEEQRLLSNEMSEAGEAETGRVSEFSGTQFVYSKVIRFSEPCLACHSNAKAEDVAGLLSVSYSLSSLRVGFIHSFMANAVILVATLVFCYLIYTRQVRRSIINPFHLFVGKLRQIRQSSEVEFQPSNAPYSEIAEIENLILQEHTDLIDAFKRIEIAAVTDELTGLFNRKKLMADLMEELQRFERYQTPFTLISVDLNKFKPINDTYGHSVGDCALKHFARLLSNNVRQTDRCFRMGGDEFLIVLPETGQTGAEVVVQAITLALSRIPLMIDQDELFLNASFGVAEIQTGDDMESVMQRADLAMYQHKKALKAGRR